MGVEERGEPVRRFDRQRGRQDGRHWLSVHTLINGVMPRVCWAADASAFRGYADPT